MVNKLPAIGEIWTHFKGGRYRICAFAWCAVGDALVLRVLYQQDMEGDGDKPPVFSRTISNFLEPVNGCPRFDRGS